MNRVSDKVTIITGATSGIGRAAAELFAREGALLVLAGRRQDRGEQLTESLRSKGADVDFVQTDISEPLEIDRLVKFALDKYGRIDILVNNAGYGGKNSYLAHEFDDQVREKYFKTNVYGTMNLCRAVLPGMVERGCGSIVNTASIGSELAVPMNSIYAATKGAIRQLTKTIAVEYAPMGIRCNAVCPGLTRTEMIPDDSGDIEKAVLPTIPMHRIGQPEEIAAGILFLASDEASFITGHMLLIDGGQSCN